MRRNVPPRQARHPLPPSVHSGERPGRLSCGDVNLIVGRNGNYYVQALNLTAAHGHAALFGVYGMLGIGLMLFCLRGLFARSRHADRYLAWTFRGLNIGLAMMVFLSLLPAGIYQAWASVSQGLCGSRARRRSCTPE